MEGCFVFFLLSHVLLVQGQAFPSFVNLPPSITINETLTTNSEVLRVVSRSTNRGTIPYTLSCLPSRSLPTNACDVFQLTSTGVTLEEWSGFISLRQPLDSITTPQYTLALNAVDSTGQSVVGTLRIIIRTTRLRPPSFSGQTEVEIDQRTSASQQQILQFSARGGDSLSRAYDVNYRIQDGPFKDYFSIDPVLGRLTNTKPLTYNDPLLADKPALITIQAAYVINGVPAWDNPSASSTSSAQVFLRDTNINKPTFDKTSYAGAIKENAPPQTAVNSVFFSVTDQDRSPSSSSFALTLDNYNDIFQVRPSSGYKQLDARLSLRTNQFFNFNTGPRSYTFNVIATETLSSQRSSSSASVNVSIIQVNRFAPQFFQNPYFANVQENAVAGTPLITVKAWDKDVGDFGNRSIRYRFSTGAAERFSMNTLSGLISVANCRKPGFTPCLDFEDASLRNIRLLVWAADLRGEGKTGTTTVVVNVTNVNDNQPSFAAETYFATIDDSSTSLSPLTPTILATDGDNDLLRYTIESGNSLNAWSINPSTGLLTPNFPITYSAAPFNGTYQLVIAASDGLYRTPANVIISVKPINRYPPLFQPLLYNVTIFETQLPGESIVRVRATDQDHPSTPGGKMQFRIISGSRGKFTIDTNTGDIAVSPGQSLDFRKDPLYNLTVQASDLGAPSKSAESVVLIYLLPKRPYLRLPDTTHFIADAAPVSSVITVLRPVSSQLGSSVVYNYNTNLQPTLFDRNNNQLPSPTTDQLEMFRIERESGTVIVNKGLDGQQVSRWQTEVEVATISNPPLTAKGMLIIWISVANKVPPSFQYPWSVLKPVYNMSVQQGDNFRTIAGTFTATPFNSSLSVVYTLVDPNNFFQLQSSTSGLIRQIRPINQGTSNYQLLLTATDNGQPPLTSNATINVIVLSVNQNAPVFSAGRYDTQIFDDAAVGKEVVRVQATDQDKGDFGVVRYALTASDPSFSINRTSGLIRVSRSDFSARLEPYILLEVRAFDSPTNSSKRKFAIAYVNITVLDANNNAPVFQPSTYQTIIYTNMPQGEDVLKVSASDADLGENARITYSIVKRNDDDKFEVDGASGQIRLKTKLGADETNYTLTIQATDAGNPSLQGLSEVVVLVKVRCTDNCNPMWIRPPDYLTRVNVKEDIAVNTPIYSLTARPYQTRSTLDFGFARGGNVSNLAQTLDSFSLASVGQPNSANIIVSRALDYNTRRNYELVTVVRDGSVANSEVLRYLVISVLPVKQFMPRFAFNTNNFCTLPLVAKIPQGSPVGARVAEIKATPNHVFDSIAYSIPDNSETPFRVDSQGVVYVTRQLDTSRDYSFNIKAAYAKNTNNLQQTQQLCNSIEDQSSVKMTVQVYKLFFQDMLTVCYKENADDGSVVESLNSLLNEPTDASLLTYTPTSMNGFEVREDGSVILQNVQTAIENEGAEIPVKVTRTLLGSSSVANIKLKPFKISSDTPLTLITLNSTLDNFNSHAKSTLLKSVSKMTQGGRQCIADAGFHTLGTGSFDQRLTDVYLYTIGGERNQVIAPLQLDALYNTVGARKEASILGITNAASRWDGFNWQPVAIAMGLIIGLLLLALLFFCCFCCWGYLSQWCINKSTDKEPMIAGNTGLVNRAWSSQPVLHEEQHANIQQDSINRGYPFDIPEIDPGPTESYNRRDDVTTMDGGGSSSVMGVPTGYVHIEAPLSRSASAFGAVDEVDVAFGAASGAAVGGSSATATTVTEKTERVVRQAYEHNHQGEPAYSNTFKGAAGARAYSSRSGGLDNIDDGDDQQPVQLNDTSAPGSSQIGAVLIRPETPRGQGYTQRIVGGSEGMPDQPQMASYEYSNFEESTLAHDPARLNMAMQNEVMMNSVTTRGSYYDETMGTARQADIRLNNYGTENNYEQFEETKYL